MADFILYHTSYYDTAGPLNLKTQLYCVSLVSILFYSVLCYIPYLQRQIRPRHKHIICCLHSKLNQSVNQRVG